MRLFFALQGRKDSLHLRVDGLGHPVVYTFCEHSARVHLCLPGCISVQVNAPWHIFMFDKEREGGEPRCDMHAIITSSFAFKAPNVELHRRLLAMQIHTVLQRG